MSRLGFGLVAAGAVLLPAALLIGGHNGLTALGVVLVVFGISMQTWHSIRIGGAGRG